VEEGSGYPLIEPFLLAATGRNFSRVEKESDGSRVQARSHKGGGEAEEISGLTRLCENSRATFLDIARPKQA